MYASPLATSLSCWEIVSEGYGPVVGARAYEFEQVGIGVGSDVLVDIPIFHPF